VSKQTIVCVNLYLPVLEIHTHTHMHMGVYIYMFIYIYVCVCVCVCFRQEGKIPLHVPFLTRKKTGLFIH
jgi:hypothetical protein